MNFLNTSPTTAIIVNCNLILNWPSFIVHGAKCWCSRQLFHFYERAQEIQCRNILAKKTHVLDAMNTKWKKKTNQEAKEKIPLEKAHKEHIERADLAWEKLNGSRREMSRAWFTSIMLHFWFRKDPTYSLSEHICCILQKANVVLQPRNKYKTW